jgi:hypothetical protein
MSIVSVKDLSFEFDEITTYCDKIIDELINDINQQIESYVGINSTNGYNYKYTIPSDIDLQDDETNKRKLYIYGVLIQKFIDAGYTVRFVGKKEEVYLDIKWSLQENHAAKKYKSSVAAIEKYS